MPPKRKGGKSKGPKPQQHAPGALVDLNWALMNPQAKSQLDLTICRERMMYAAAHKHFKVLVLPASFKPDSDNAMQGGVPCVKQTHKEPVPQQLAAATELNPENIEDWEKTLAPGSLIKVNWFDPRADAEVWQPAGPSSGWTTPFTYWDGPSLALELHVNAMGLGDHERKAARGNMLYCAYDKGYSWVFWSIVIHFHATGRAFPPAPPKFEEGGVVTKEVSRLTEGVQAMCQGRTNSNIVISSEADAVVGTFSEMNERQATGKDASTKKMKIPIGDFNVRSVFALPAWYAAQEELWGGLFGRYLEQGASAVPCMFVCKDAGCMAKTKCPAEHKPMKEAWAKVEQVLSGNIKEQHAKKGGVSVDEDMAANSARCCNPDCPGGVGGALKSESEFQRCSKCKNVLYCDAACQKAHWKRHKPHCRDPTDVECHEQVWCVVLPADKRIRPYAKLITAHTMMRSMAKEVFGDINLAQGKLGALPVERGDDKNGCFMFCRMDLQNGSTDQNHPANLRASAMATPPDGQMNLIDSKGPKVRVRGDALLFRTQIRSEPGLNPRDPRSYHVNPVQPYDLGYDFFNMQWGLFQCIQMPESGSPPNGERGEMCTALMPNTPEFEKIMADTLSGAFSGRGPAPAGGGGGPARGARPQSAGRGGRGGPSGGGSSTTPSAPPAVPLPANEQELERMSMKEIKAVMAAHNIKNDSFCEKAEFITAIMDHKRKVQPTHTPTPTQRGGGGRGRGGGGFPGANRFPEGRQGNTMSDENRNEMLHNMMSGLVDDDTSMGEQMMMQQMMGGMLDLTMGADDDDDLYDRLVQHDIRNGHAPPAGYYPGCGAPDKKKKK